MASYLNYAINLCIKCNRFALKKIGKMLVINRIVEMMGVSHQLHNEKKVYTEENGVLLVTN